MPKISIPMLSCSGLVMETSSKHQLQLLRKLNNSGHCRNQSVVDASQIYTTESISKATHTCYLPDRPQTLHELMMLYSNMSMTSSIEDEVETCEMAIAADDVDKTMAM
jgi:hypothetical protein